MRYPSIRYVPIRERYLELLSFDVTRRGVLFRSEEATAAALLPGRAAIDVTAVEAGFLPRGAQLVCRATAGDIDDILSEAGGDRGALAKVRLKFSIDLLASRSEWIDGDRDALARERDPESARRYEAIAAEVEASERRGRKGC